MTVSATTMSVMSSREKPLLSVALITFNEEIIIERTLSAIHNWVDEIVVVDSYSSDRTVEIVNLFDVKLIQKEWQGYSEQKNFALSKCTGGWVLVLDADEVVSNPLREEIQKVIAKPGIKTGFKIPRKLYIGNKWVKYGGHFPDYQLRLFKNNLGARFCERKVHESITLKGPKGYLKNPLEHYAYVDISDYKVTLDKYAELASKEIGDKKLYFPLGRAVWAFGYRYFVRKGFMEGKLGFELAKAYGEYVYKKYLLARKK